MTASGKLRHLAILLAMSVAAGAMAEVTVDNFQPGELVRYPVVMLHGHAGADKIAVGRDWSSAHHFPVVHGEYRALVELKPGVNMLVLQAGRSILRYRVDYRPPTTPMKVLAVWIRTSDDPGGYAAHLPGSEPRVFAKFDTALKLIQSLYAEAMHDAGFGRKTFSLELDKRGQTVVHIVTVPKTALEMRAMENNASWSYLYGLLGKQFPEASTHWCTILGYSAYDTQTHRSSGHYALGGGSLGAFGSSSMDYWPASIPSAQAVLSDPTQVDPDRSQDDSNGRRTIWANVATAYGAIAHEMGHTFGLPHSHDPFSVMSRGFDFFNRTFTVEEPPRAGASGMTLVHPGQYSRWDPFEAARLNWNAYFQADRPTSIESEPKILIAGDEVTITAPAGIRVWGADRDDVTPYFRDLSQGEAPNRVTASLRDLAARLGTRQGFRITVVDSAGRNVTIDAPPSSI